ncbi:SPFH domain-containing protein [Rhodocytophaga aerolata]|uniref:SPFH domain-containing protein n=1 Tax=Rhodocytophaga aerolata TaxID=455078 RepID=A0ABT8RH98_9BACT|nr:SPFH domain-containing protein [Rhodocytophaga aerolata]MDO1450533.1 SPFH domain-containing protein [Rhodocytophaga aerolata]
MTATTIILILLTFFVLVTFLSSFKVVPQRSAYIVERLGKYSRTLEAGFHVLIPYIDRIAYKQNQKEQAIDVAAQICITKDNIAVEVDGILYLQVIDPLKASYGIDNYKFAVVQISQTTMRSIIGKMELDKTFEERETVNGSIVEAVDKASGPWGIKVSRYEVKNISPPQSIKDAMEKQMRAEREKRALIAESEGDKQAKINRAEGEKQETIARSEGEKQRRINEATGRATEIELVAVATAKGITEIARSINEEGGMNAVNLRVAEQYLTEFGKLAKVNNTMIVPADLSDIAGVLTSITSVLNKTKVEPPLLTNGNGKKVIV